jgi:hypothetical protein
VTAAELAQASTRATPAQLHPKAVHLVIFSIETENVRGYGKVEKDYLKTPDGRRPPTQIAAIIRYILRDLLPFKFKTKSNDRVPGQDTKKTWGWYKRHFGSNKFWFTIRRSEEPDKPDANYAVVENVRITFARWKLVFQGICLDCPSCKMGKLIHDRFPFLKASCVAIPVINLDPEMPVEWVVPMSYECNSCKVISFGSDGRMLHQLPIRTQLEHPVEFQSLYTVLRTIRFNCYGNQVTLTAIGGRFRVSRASCR